MVRRERRTGSGRVCSLDANETRNGVSRLAPSDAARDARFFFRLVFITGEGERARARRLRAHVTVARFCDISSSSYPPRVTNDTRVRSMKEDCAAVFVDSRWSRCESTRPIETSTSIDFNASFRFFGLLFHYARRVEGEPVFEGVRVAHAKRDDVPQRNARPQRFLDGAQLDAPLDARF